MAENVTDVFKIPREPLIHNRYRHILDQVIQLEPVALEEIKVDVLRRLCGFSNTAVISAYVTRPDDPTIKDMELLHLALSGEYADRIDDEPQTKAIGSVHYMDGVVPKVTPSDRSVIEITNDEPENQFPAMSIEDLRFLAKNAVRELTVLDESLELGVTDSAVAIELVPGPVFDPSRISVV